MATERTNIQDRQKDKQKKITETEIKEQAINNRKIKQTDNNPYVYLYSVCMSVGYMYIYTYMYIYNKDKLSIKQL